MLLARKFGDVVTRHTSASLHENCCMSCQRFAVSLNEVSIVARVDQKDYSAACAILGWSHMKAKTMTEV